MTVVVDIKVVDRQPNCMQNRASAAAEVYKEQDVTPTTLDVCIPATHA